MSTRTPSAEQPTIPDPLPEVPEPQVPENPLPSETIPPPEQFADREHPDPPRNEVPQPDPANFKVRTIFSSLDSPFGNLVFLPFFSSVN